MSTVEVSRVVYAEQGEGQWPSLVVHGQVDGGVRDVEAVLSLAPREGTDLRRFWALVELGDVRDLEVDDDSNELIGPDLVGLTITSDGDDLPWPFELP